MKNVLILGECKWEIDNYNGCQLYCEGEFKNVNLRCDEEGSLFYLDSDQNWLNVDVVIWRSQFDADFQTESKLLDIICLSNVRCINPVSSIINYSRNIPMYKAIQDAGLNSLKREVFMGPSSGYLVTPELSSPKILKVGDHHSGFGKSIIRNQESYQDTIDMVVLLNDFYTMEPYIRYKQDIRVTLIGDKLYINERVPSMWKANVCPIAVKDIPLSEIDEEIIEGTKRLAEKIGASVLGADWLLGEDGQWYIIEANMSPGLSPENEKMVIDLI